VRRSTFGFRSSSAAVSTTGIILPSIAPISGATRSRSGIRAAAFGRASMAFACCNTIGRQVLVETSMP